MTTKQVETATVVGTITSGGNAKAVITARDMTNSPKTITAAVSLNDTAAMVAAALRSALAFDADVTAVFVVSGTGANIVLTAHIAQANDSTLNIAINNDTCTGLTAAPTSANTAAGDGLENAYCTLAQVKDDQALKQSGTSNDGIIELTINAVSRAIENYCGRRFYPVTEIRYYTSEMSDMIFVDDIATDSGLTLATDNDGDRTYETAWASTDYDLLPANAVLEGQPYNMISIAPQGKNVFPGTKKGVKITASFGFPAIPHPVNRACVMQTIRIFQRYKTMLGVSSATAFGTLTVQVPAFDSDVCMLLDPYVRLFVSL